MIIILTSLHSFAELVFRSFILITSSFPTCTLIEIISLYICILYTSTVNILNHIRIVFRCRGGGLAVSGTFARDLARGKYKTPSSADTHHRELGFAVAGASPKKVFTCQLCGKVLCSKASLKRHIADKHAERQEEYRCVICERVYCSRNSLMTHIYTYHKSRPGDIDIKFF